MTSINMVVLVGKILKEAPRTGVMGSGKKYARFTVETEKYVILNGQRTRVAFAHKVVCFNQFSVGYLERAQPGQRVRVTGELAYDQAGKAEIQVPLYGGEVGPMDVEGQNPSATGAQETPEETKRPEAGRAPTPTTRPSGGFGRLNVQQEAREPSGTGVAQRRLTDSELDDEIPF